MSWIVIAVLLLAIVAVAGVLLEYFLRTTPITRIRSIDGGVARMTVASPTFRQTVSQIAGARLERGNRIEILPNGDATFPRLWEELARARHVITWQIFWFKPGRLAERAFDVLRERARAGVRVHLLLDAFGARGLGDDYLDRLREAGVRVDLFRPFEWTTLYKVQQRMHVRSVVIDARVAFTGGFGIDDRWLGTGRQAGSWRDTNVRLEGPIVNQLQSVFVANWAEATGELLIGDGVFALDPALADGEHVAGLVHGVPSLGSTLAERLLVLSIVGAQQRLYVTNAYFIPDDGLCDLLVDAVKRGVDVRVITPGRNTDRISAWLAGRAHYERLLEAGVRIYHYRPSMIHAKTMVVDGTWSMAGTLNFDNRSLKLNDEVVVVSTDREVAERLEQLFEEDLRWCDPVDLDEIRSRPWTARAQERLASLVAPVL